MHRALLLPEIVAAILDTGKSSPGLLHNTLLVNRLFFTETSRIFWFACASFWTDEHPSPQIRDLARLVEQDVQRAQLYANFVHYLWFESARLRGVEGTLQDDDLWHSQLTQLDFPQLEEVESYWHPRKDVLNVEDTILHYAQPGLKRLQLRGHVVLSQSFFEVLPDRSPMLQELLIIPAISATEDSMVQFLERATRLENLRITKLQGGWTQKSFEAVSKHPTLDIISIPAIEEAWIPALKRFDREAVFPKARVLTTVISDSGLEQFHPFAQGVEILYLYKDEEPSPSHHTLAAAANFPKLDILQVRLQPGSTIHGSDLLLLAQSCPDLTELSVEHVYPFRPTGKDITDDVLEAFARLLPKLKELYLAFDAPVLPSLASLRALGRHCPMLQRLTLSCTIDWDQVREMPEEIIFPELNTLVVNPNSDRQLSSVVGEEEAARLEEKVKTWAHPGFYFHVNG